MSDALTEALEDLDQLSGLDLCLTCFGLKGQFRGKTHQCRCEPMEDDWRERGEWAGYDIPLLVEVCRLCVRGTMKSGSRWTTYACRSCLDLNHAVGRALGAQRGALPLGRHSLMNGLSARPEELQNPELRSFATAMRGLLKIWFRLADWKVEEGLRLAESSGVAGRGTVPWAEWVLLSPSSEGASADAF